MGKLPWFPKYIVGPALAAALGYLVIGPRLAGSKRFQNLVKEKASQMANSEPSAGSKPDETATTEPSGTEPEVKVGVKPVDEEPKPTRRRRRRSHSDD